jgi:hypothetical protein
MSGYLRVTVARLAAGDSAQHHSNRTPDALAQPVKYGATPLGAVLLKNATDASETKLSRDFIWMPWSSR